jgi:hypothetical protein
MIDDGAEEVCGFEKSSLDDSNRAELLALLGLNPRQGP